MSVETLALVLHHSRATGTDKLVLIGIANHDGDGGAWPSVSTLAKYANVQPRAVQKSIRKLEQLGEVVVHRNAGGTLATAAHERPNRYDVMVACPPNCDRTKNHRLQPLPAAPADLWIEGVSARTGGVQTDTGGGVPQDTRTVLGTSPHADAVSQLPVVKAPSAPRVAGQNYSAAELEQFATRGVTCATCSLPALDCCSRSATNGHKFTPSRSARRLRSVES